MSLEESKWRTGLSSAGLEPLVAPGLLAGCLEFSGGRIPQGFIFLVVVSTIYFFWLL
jgi:hypothetical protein